MRNDRAALLVGRLCSRVDVLRRELKRREAVVTAVGGFCGEENGTMRETRGKKKERKKTRKVDEAKGKGEEEDERKRKRGPGRGKAERL